MDLIDTKGRLNRKIVVSDRYPLHGLAAKLPHVAVD